LLGKFYPCKFAPVFVPDQKLAGGLIGSALTARAAVTVSAITWLILAKFESHSGSLSEFFVLDVTIIQIALHEEGVLELGRKQLRYLNYFRHSSLKTLSLV